MSNQEPTNPSRLVDELNREPTYDGYPGSTHTGMVHYSCPCGTIFPVSVLESVNVNTDRDLAEAAVAGQLNQAYCPSCNRQAAVDISYVLHHPQEERFILVIPESQRHLDLQLRAEILKKLSEASAVPVPTYVREFQVVFGTEGLRVGLSRPPHHVALREELVNKQAELEERERHLTEVERIQGVRDSQLSEKELAVESQEESVTAREERLKERGEHVTRMEDDLHQRTAQLQARVATYEVQIQGLEARETKITEVEQTLLAQTQQMQEWEMRLRASEQSLVEAHAAADSGQTQIAPHPLPISEVAATLTGEIEEKISTNVLSTAGQPIEGTAEQTQRRGSMTASMADEVVEDDEEIDDAEELTDDDLEEAEELSADDLIEGEADIIDEPMRQETEQPATPIQSAEISSIPAAMPGITGEGVSDLMASPPPQMTGLPQGSGAAAESSPATPFQGAAATESAPPQAAEIPAPAAESSLPAGTAASPVPGVESSIPQPAAAPAESVAPADAGAVTQEAPPVDQVESAEQQAIEVPAPPPPNLPEPPAHWVRSGQQTLHRVDGTDVNLFVRLDGETAEKILDGGADLWVQLHLLPTYPLITLSLILEPEAEELSAIHWIIDIEEDEDRNLLQLLRRRFRANILLFDLEHALLDEVTFEPPREVNVAHVVDRATQELGEIGPTQLSPAQAREKFRTDWDWAGKKKHPFTEDAYAEITSAADAKLALGILTYWSEPQNHEYLVLVKSVPVDLLDTITRRILEGATKFGLWLSPPLRDRAVALALAADAASLTARLIDSFANLGPGPESLDLAEVAENWQRLLRDADELDIPVSKDTIRLAEGLIDQASTTEDRDDLEADPTELGPVGELSDEELSRLLERRAVRTEAALELASRNDPTHLEALFRAARKMSRTDLIKIMPVLLKYGESAGDYFMEGLTSRKSFTRQACGLALGELKLRRAVVPLLHQMMNEKTPVWSEIARALGHYGPTGIKPLLRYLRDPKGQEERLIRALSFFAIHGAVKQVEELSSGDEPGVAALAREALDMRDKARNVEEQVAGEEEVDGQAPLIRFSRRLHQSFTGDGVIEDDDLLEELGDSDILELDEEDD